MTSSSITSQTLSSPPPTTTSSSFMSSSDQITASGVPKFKSTPPPSLPISPSSFFSIPGGLSPADLLDSPVLLSSSNNLASPTTGSFPFHAFNWKTNLSTSNRNEELGILQERRNFSDFSFQTQSNPPADHYQQPRNQDDKDLVKSEYQPQTLSFSPEISTIQTNSISNCTNSSEKRTEDGYNWRKYGQKQVKGSQNPRGYYKCTYPNCSTRKKVERSLDGQITEIVYRGSHNHAKPQLNRKSWASNNSQFVHQDSSNHELNDSYGTPENSSVSVGDEVDEDEPKAKSRRMEGENEGMSTDGSRMVREARVVVQTVSDIDILDDGFRWRKYGQKVVKGNPNPRSYYKCTTPGCSVRKHVERASNDSRSVITTYQGRHNHDVPLARGNVATIATRPLGRPVVVNAIRDINLPRTPFTLQSHGSFDFSRLGFSYVNQQHNSNNVFPKTKEEPKDDMFLDSLLC